jgi:hypothetical protein
MRSVCRLLVPRYIYWTSVQCSSVAISIVLKNKENYANHVTVFRDFTNFGDLRHGSLTSKNRGRFLFSTCGHFGERAALSVETKHGQERVQFLQHSQSAACPSIFAD